MKLVKLMASQLKNNSIVLNISTTPASESDFLKLNELSKSDLSEYEFKIEKVKKKRSLDSNAYLWALIGQIAKKLNTSTLEVYRNIIKDTSAYTIIPIREDCIEKWIEIWSAKGSGWICDDIGECSKTKGYHNIRCYHGTSAYDSSEMNHLLELVIAECHTLGIETLTPQELEELKGINQ